MNLVALLAVLVISKATAPQKGLLCKSGLRNISAHFVHSYDVICIYTRILVVLFHYAQYWLFSRQETAMESAFRGILISTHIHIRYMHIQGSS